MSGRMPASASFSWTTFRHRVEHVLQSRAMGFLTEDIQEPGDVMALRDLLGRFNADQRLLRAP